MPKDFHYGSMYFDIHDFNKDGDDDIIVVSNFADMERNPERGIIYLEYIGEYKYLPYSIPEAVQNQWNIVTVRNFDNDGD